MIQGLISSTNSNISILVYVVGGEDGDIAEKRNFDGIYVVGGEDGETAEKRNFDGIYVVGGEDGETAEKRHSH